MKNRTSEERERPEAWAAWKPSTEMFLTRRVDNMKVTGDLEEISMEW